MIAALALHAALLGLAGWAGGSPSAGYVILGLLGCHVLECVSVAERPDIADRSALGIGLGILAVVVSSLAFPGVGTRVGWGLWATALALRLWAIHTLGRRFLDAAALAPGHVRSHDGPYRWLDHPADLGTLGMTLGIASILGSVVAVALWGLVLVPLLAWRAAAEDRLWAMD